MNTKVLVIASKEWRDGWRNRWVLAITLVFAFMAVGLSWFGSVAYGEIGTASLETTIASLSSLAVLVIPLIALLLGYDAYVGEQDQGTLLLILTYPVTKFQLVLGKFLGQGAILAIATFVGFGSAAVLLFIKNFDLTIIYAFGVFIGSAVLLGGVFLAIAHLISIAVSEKSRAVGLALFVWFFFTLIYDLGLLSLLVASNGWLDQTVLQALLLLNPTDLFRVINLLHLDAQGSGALASLGELDYRYGTLISLFFLWIAAGLAATTTLLKHKNI